MLTAAERQQLIERLRALPDRLDALVAGLSAADLHTPYLSGEWTVAQNVHHLADAHMNVFIRLKLLLTEEYPTLKPFEQTAWAVTPDAVDLPPDSSLLLLRGLHLRWAALFAALTDEQWQRRARHPESGDLTAEDLLRSYAAHGEAHLDQIARTLAARG